MTDTGRSQTGADHDEAYAVESEEPEPREDGQPGPPDRWEYPSWYDPTERDWYWRDASGMWRRDPCPARPLGMRAGVYAFVTSFGEIREFTAKDLMGRAGLPDLFVGEMEWAMKHFRKYDLEKKTLVGGLQAQLGATRLMKWCAKAGGYFDGRMPVRYFGTWRSPEGKPIFHAGDRIFYEGTICEPGVKIGDALFVRDARRSPPTFVGEGRRSYAWAEIAPNLGHTVAAHLDEWVWDTIEARDLFQGGLHCDMLCSALKWLPHKFVLAPYGSGKSSLLEYAGALVGSSAHAVLKTYSKAYLEQNFAGTAAAYYLDETESDTEGDRIRRIFELVRLLSDDRAEGGRGTSSGKSRKLDVHGTVTMAATVKEEWRPQDRSRITLLEIRPFSDRGEGRPPAPPEIIADMHRQAAHMSPDLRARALATFPLFAQNLGAARWAILHLGGQPRDADQLGHLIAGWRTMTSDQAFIAGDLGEFARFRRFITSLIESEEGDDAPNDLLNVIFGCIPDLWRSGERAAVGELVALARSDEVDAPTARGSLARIGLRLEQRQGESWAEAWLAVANKHPGLDQLLTRYPEYQGAKRAQILKQLQRGEHRALTPDARMRFATVQSRYVVIPPVFLPTLKEDGR